MGMSEPGALSFARRKKHLLSWKSRSTGLQRSTALQIDREVKRLFNRVYEAGDESSIHS